MAGDGDRAVRMVVLDGVREQVEEDLLESLAVREDVGSGEPPVTRPVSGCDACGQRGLCSPIASSRSRRAASSVAGLVWPGSRKETYVEQGVANEVAWRTRQEWSGRRRRPVTESHESMTDRII